ncbi:MAG: XRE family transcriptional regulator [Oscillospiraceae bacterium]
MFGKQIKILRKSLNLSQTTLANELRVTQQAVGKWETGKSVPDSATLKQIAEYFCVTVDYLLEHEDSRTDRFSPAQHFSNTMGVGIPIIGTVKAGYDAVAYNEDYGCEYLGVSNPDEYFYLVVRGDSMEPRIKDGDLALVHKQPTLNSGELGVVVFGDNEGTLKKYIKKDNTIILQPFNPDYESKVISGEELEHVYIAGKVVETKTKW